MVPLAPALALLLAQSPVRVESAQSARLEARVRSTSPRTTRADLELVPQLQLELGRSTLDLDLRYMPRILLEPTFGSGSGRALVGSLLHRARLEGAWRLAPTRRLKLEESFAYGATDTSALAWGDDGQRETLEPQPLLGEAQYVRSDTRLWLEQRPRPRLLLRTGAGWHLGGGLSAAAREGLPLRQGPSATSEARYSLSPRTALLSHATASHTRFSHGPETSIVQAAPGLSRKLTARTEAWARAGAAAVQARPSRGLDAAWQLMPVAVASVSHTRQLAAHRLHGEVYTQVAPYVSPYNGVLYRRLEAFAQGTWRVREALAFHARTGTAHALFAPELQERVVLSEASVSYRAREHLWVGGGSRVALLPLNRSAPMQWMAFSSVTVSLPTGVAP